MSGLNLSLRDALDLARRLGCRIKDEQRSGMVSVEPPPYVTNRKTIKSRLGHADADRPFVSQLRRWERELTSKAGIARSTQITPVARINGAGLFTHAPIDVGVMLPLPWKNSKLEDARRALQRLKAQTGERP